jgi:ATP-dependent protease HslVU (ClpYQ) peptidase subunit
MGSRVVCAVSVVKDDGETAIAGQAEVTLGAS